jgi:hypothetical protein
VYPSTADVAGMVSNAKVHENSGFRAFDSWRMRLPLALPAAIQPQVFTMTCGDEAAELTLPRFVAHPTPCCLNHAIRRLQPSSAASLR